MRAYMLSSRSLAVRARPPGSAVCHAPSSGTASLETAVMVTSSAEETPVG
jgi:hypothetical protein